jgi:hypothetical protein
MAYADFFFRKQLLLVEERLTDAHPGFPLEMSSTTLSARLFTQSRYPASHHTA